MVDPIYIEREGRVTKFHGSWFRGEHTHFIPSKEDLRSESALEDYVMTGWTPPRPFISRDTPIVAFGSCFAANVSRFLEERGYAILGRGLRLKSHIIRCGEGMVNSFAIRQQLEWALLDKAFPPNLWIDEDKVVAETTAEVQAETRRIIGASKVFILTLGLSEVWYDTATGEAFWRAIPQALFDPARHGFKLSSVTENRENIRATIRLIKASVPDAAVVLTLSPVPLMATFRPMSCITASAVSKAVLRVAIDEVMAEGMEGVFYFPAYEIITAATVDPFEDDNRHPKPEAIERVMKTFEKAYCLPG
jgi:hypothetical protein